MLKISFILLCSGIAFCYAGISLSNKQYGEYSVGLKGNTAYMKMLGEEFIVRSPGLSGLVGTVSFESAQYRGHYLRLYGSNIYLEEHLDPRNHLSFNIDATFKVHEDMWYEGYMYYESITKPNHFLYAHPTNYLLYVLNFQNNEPYKNAISWKEEKYVPPKFEKKSVSVTNKNTAMYTWGLRGNDVFMKIAGNEFIMRTPGLTGEYNTVSFESTTEPGKFMRQYGNYMVMEFQLDARSPTTFDTDATFRLLKDNWYKDYVALQSLKNVNQYIRTSNYRLIISNYANTQAFRDDASFSLDQFDPPKIVTKTVSVVPMNNPTYSWGMNAADAYIKNIGDAFIMRSPGLTGEINTVSFESKAQRGHFLRTYGWLIYLDSQDNPRNIHIFDEEATFRVHESRWFKDYNAFESAKYPNRFLRHLNYRLRLDAYVEQQAFKDSASFSVKKYEAPKLERQHVAVVPKNNPSNAWGLNGNVGYIKTIGQEFVMISPGLTGEHGTVSFMSKLRPGYYMRNYGWVIYLESKTNPRSHATFDKDATFRLREDMWFKDTVAFESIVTPNRFISHDSKYKLVIPGFSNTPQFKDSASFVLSKYKSVDRQSTPIKMKSMMYPYLWGLYGDRLFLKTQAEDLIMHSPGLTGEVGTVSFESKAPSDSYLRHYGWWIYLEEEADPRNAHVFDADATFKPVKDKWRYGYYAFESVNVKNAFICNSNYQMRILPYSNTDAYKTQCSFKY